MSGSLARHPLAPAVEAHMLCFRLPIRPCWRCAATASMSSVVQQSSLSDPEPDKSGFWRPPRGLAGATGVVWLSGPSWQ